MEIIEQAVRTKLERHSPTEISIHFLTTRLERPRGISLLEDTGHRLALTRHFRERARSWAEEYSLPDPPNPPIPEPLSFWLGLDGSVPLLPGVALCFKRATLWANTLVLDGTEVEARKEGACQLALDTLGILWDGSLTLCCLDFDGVLTFGEVSHGTITDALQSEEYKNLRQAFEEHRLVRYFCQRCRGHVKGPLSRRLVPGSLPALAGEALIYLSRFRLRRTLRRLPQELGRYLGR
jgi:hypothetical protein